MSGNLKQAKPQRAALYVRISRDKDKHDPVKGAAGVQRQEKDCREHALKLGWTIVEVFRDNDVSATSRKPRPQYAKMLADIEAEKVDAVIAWDLDRLHRQPRELEIFIDLADTFKIALATVSGEVDLGTDNGRLHARIKGAVARADVERMAARKQALHKDQAENGLLVNLRIRPFGYERDGTTLRTVEADALREAIRGVISGESLNSVCVRWNKAGITTSRGNPWRIDNLTEVLKRPRNAAISIWQGQEVGVAQWPQIVTREQHSALLAVLERNKRPGHSSARKHLLSGVATCGRCGTLTIRSAQSPGRPAQYRCDIGKGGCGLSILKDTADRAVRDYVVHRLADDQDEHYSPGNAADLVHVEALNTELHQLENDERHLALSSVSFAFKQAQAEVWAQRKESIEAELTIYIQRDAITSLLYDLRTSPKDWGQEAALTFIHRFDVIQTRFAHLDLAQKQTVIKALCEVSILSATIGSRAKDYDASYRLRFVPKSAGEVIPEPVRQGALV